MKKNNDDKRSTTPPGAGDDAAVRTRRDVQRRREDARYTPVIVKRTDETRRHPDDVLQAAIAAGCEQLDRPTLSLALSSLAAGLILGFTAMIVAVVTVASQGIDNPALVRLITGAAYPAGFVLCIMSGTELFTEHTATAVYPVLERRASFWSLLRLWVIVAAGNLVGAACSAGLLTAVDVVVGAREGYVAIGHHLMSFDSWPVLLSALLAGWLMALGTWLILATPPTLTQFLSIYLVTFLIGAGGLHHSIAGAVEMFAAAMVSNEFTLSRVAGFIGLALVGNLIGGSLFVAVLNYGHIRESQATED